MDQDDIDDIDEQDDPDEQKEYYLYECNTTRDIENNIGETLPPEFTMEDIILIDEKYKRIFDELIERVHKESETVDELTNLLELNELYMEHRSNIEKLISMMNEYNSIYRFVTLNTELTAYERTIEYMNARTKQFQMYFQDIQPILQTDEENYKNYFEYAYGTTKKTEYTRKPSTRKYKLKLYKDV
jgi:hypothetical protein